MLLELREWSMVGSWNGTLQDKLACGIAHALKVGSGGMTCHKWQKHNLHPRRSQRGTLRWIESVQRVVAGFGINVGLESSDFVCKAGTGKDEYRLHAAQTGQCVGAVLLVIDWAAIAFERTHRGVAIDGDDEQIAECRGLPEICQMTAMKQIKAAVGEYHTAADRCGLPSQGEQLL